jgi:hypothetical protein
VFLLGPLNYQQQLKSCKNNIWWFKVVILPMQLKVLIHSPMQLKMVAAAVKHLRRTR